MSHNDNTAAQMLRFPVQRMTEEELAACDDIGVSYWQARLAITQKINEANRYNNVPPAPSLLRLIKDFNAHAVECGFAPLNVRFD